MNRGFSLIEVMISSVIFAVSVAGVVSAFHTSTRLSAHFEHETAAALIGESVLEELILKARGDADLAPNATISRTYDAKGDQSPLGPYTARWTVTPNEPIAGLKQIALTVTWAEETTTRRVAFTTVRE